jgi:osmotically-inducible protein OsmY
MSEDGELKQAVLAELTWEPSVTAAHIGVTARNGVVTLTGHVQNYSEKYAAEAAVGRVKGVKAVAEELEVRLPSSFKRADDQIASAAVDRLSWNVSVPRDAVIVKVENGWITLTGQVDWHYQYDSATRDISQPAGVVGVSNNITIKPRLSASNISDDITRALHRSWSFKPKTVNVSAQDGKVTLSGTVHSWHDRQLAASTAWGAPGATSVENDIAVI